MKEITTENLLEIILNNPKKMIEARLIINNFLRGTHFIYFNGKNIFDEGIDGEKKLVSKKYFFENYNFKYWIIDNII